MIVLSVCLFVCEEEEEERGEVLNIWRLEECEIYRMARALLCRSGFGLGLDCLID